MLPVCSRLCRPFDSRSTDTCRTAWKGVILLSLTPHRYICNIWINDAMFCRSVIAKNCSKNSNIRVIKFNREIMLLKRVWYLQTTSLPVNLSGACLSNSPCLDDQLGNQSVALWMIVSMLLWCAIVLLSKGSNQKYTFSLWYSLFLIQHESV